MPTANTAPPHEPARLAVTSSGTPASAITEPNSGFKDVGFQPRQSLPAQFLNWLFSRTYLALDWLLGWFDATGAKRLASVDSTAALAALDPKPRAWAALTVITRGTYVDDGAGHIYYASAVGSSPHQTGSTNPFDLEALAGSPVTDGDITWTSATNQSGYGVSDGDIYAVKGLGLFRYYAAGTGATGTPYIPASSSSTIITATSQGALAQQWARVDWSRVGAAGGVPQTDLNGKTAFRHLQLAAAPRKTSTFYEMGERIIAQSAVWENVGNPGLSSATATIALFTDATPAAGDEVADTNPTWKCVDTAAPWQPNTAYLADNRVRVVGEGIWKVTSVSDDGLSGSTPPDWDTGWTSGSPGEDYQVEWEYVGPDVHVVDKVNSDSGVVIAKDGRIDPAQLPRAAFTIVAMGLINGNAATTGSGPGYEYSFDGAGTDGPTIKSDKAPWKTGSFIWLTPAGGSTYETILRAIYDPDGSGTKMTIQGTKLDGSPRDMTDLGNSSFSFAVVEPS